MRILQFSIFGAIAAVKPNDVAKGLADFGWHSLLANTNDTKLADNTVMSPLSIAGCMYMLAAGVGQTAQNEILSAFKFAGNDNSVAFDQYVKIVDAFNSQTGAIVDIASAIFHKTATDPNINQSPNEDYMAKMTNIATREATTFGVGTAKDRINEWVNTATHGKITSLYDEDLDGNTLMVLISSLYFKGTWNVSPSFDVAKNLEDTYCWRDHNPGNKKLGDGNACVQTVKWIKTSADFRWFRFREADGTGFVVVDIPMKEASANALHDKFVYQIWMPEGFHITDAPGDKRMRRYIEKYKTTIRQKLRKEKLRLAMPKFSVEWEDDLVETLQSFGIEKVFQEGGADFSPMLGSAGSKGSGVFVDHVKHKVKIDVDEHGIEGAAVTSAGVTFRSLSNPRSLTINSPFYFLINNRCWDSSNSKNCKHPNIPLFAGKISKPHP